VGAECRGVVIEGAEADAAGCGEEGLFGDGEVDPCAGDLPAMAFSTSRGGEFGGVFEGFLGHTELVDLEDWAWTMMPAGGWQGGSWT